MIDKIKQLPFDPVELMDYSTQGILLRQRKRALDSRPVIGFRDYKAIFGVGDDTPQEIKREERWYKVMLRIGLMPIAIGAIFFAGVMLLVMITGMVIRELYYAFF